MTRMTRKEARQIITSWLVSSKGEKGQCGYIEGWFYEKDVEAFQMAIEALKIQDESKTKNIIYDFLTAKLGENIMNNPFEFEDWFNRMVWHVQECYKLNKKLLMNTSGYDLKSRQDEESEMAIEALQQEPNPFCALADRECPFQGKEYAWCLTCPHISEEDRALVKKVASEPKRGKWIEDECYPYCVCNKCGQMCGIQNNGWCNYGARME